MPIPAKLTDLLPRYDGFLVDAYGVLNDAAGALPGAAALVRALEPHPWLVLTNDSSRLPSTIAARLRGFGLPIADERVLSSGMLLAGHVNERALRGRRAIVLGSDESRQMARDAGLAIVTPRDDADVVIVADDEGFDFLADIERVINLIARAPDIALVLPNPDWFYPRGDGVGLTAGAVAHLIEAAVARRIPDAPRFVGLGKPHAPIYAAAKQRLRGNLLAIGDQLDTDVAGALAAGLDVAFVASAAGRWEPGLQPEPTWVIVEG